jgi:hypothetical protein
MERLGIQGMTTINAFDHVAVRLAGCLEDLTELIDKLDFQG